MSVSRFRISRSAFAIITIAIIATIAIAQTADMANTSNNIENLEKIIKSYDTKIWWSGFFSIIALFITLGTAIYSQYFLYHRSIASDSLQELNNERFSNLNNEAAQANKIASEATKQSNEAIVKQKELEESNLKLRIELEKLEKTSNIHAKKIEHTEKAIAPRHLTTDQKDKLIAFLKTISGETINFGFTSQKPEVTDFMNELINVFEKSNWIIGERSLLVGLRLEYPLIIAVKSKEEAPSYAGALQKAFSDIGFQAHGFYHADIESKQIVIYISSNDQK